MSSGASGKWKAEALCPFFRDESVKRQTVFCSGVKKGQKLQIYFKRENERQEWLRGRCASWAFETCPYCKMLTAAADEEEEKRRQNKK